jgi:nitrate/nitrite-specific signal transduction histidine kinase
MAEAPSNMSGKGKDSKELFTKGKDFLDMYSKVAEFTRELMEENHRLQGRINELIGEREMALAEGAGDPAVAELVRRLEELKKEKQDLVNQYRQVEEENKDFLFRYREIEAENNNLANLYVASYQLHSTLDLDEVLSIITEIIINLIGAQVFGIMIINNKRQELEPMKTEGMPLSALPLVRIGEGIIGQVAQSGQAYYRESPDPTLPINPLHPMVCVPLSVEENIIGVIVVYQLLPQKERLVKIDFDLFNLLAGHAATAIFSSKLYSDSIRKQKTIKGFIDLMIHPEDGRT